MLMSIEAGSGLPAAQSGRAGYAAPSNLLVATMIQLPASSGCSVAARAGTQTGGAGLVGAAMADIDVYNTDTVQS